MTAGLGLDGGGRAVVGRLLARAGAEYAAARGVAFRVLELVGDGAPAGAWLEDLPPTAIETFGGRRARLAVAALAEQLFPRGGRPRPALLFDLLGLARIEAVLPAALRGPYAVVLYGIEIWRPLSWAAKRALTGADARFTISRAALARAEPYLPLPPEDFALLPLALEDRPPAGAPDAEILAGAGEGFTLIVGRMGASERYKGHDELLAAWPHVAARVPGARLVVAGGGDDRARLEEKAAALGFGASVHFTGFVSEATLAELYRRAALFALPSSGEGFGLVFLEAMRAGTPCVALTGTAPAEIVADGATGRLVPPGDPKALEAVLVSLLSDPARARALGAAGKARERQAFGYDRFRSTLFDHLDRVLAG